MPNQAALPLRQALQQRRPQAKIVDITEKFTRACNGKSVLLISVFTCACYCLSQSAITCASSRSASPL